MPTVPEQYSIFLKQLLYLLCRLVPRPMQHISGFPITHHQWRPIQNAPVQWGALDAKFLIFLELITNRPLRLDMSDTNLPTTKRKPVPSFSANRNRVAAGFCSEPPRLRHQERVKGSQSVRAGYQ